MKRKISIETVTKPVMRLPFVNVNTIHVRERGLLAAVNFSWTGRDANIFLVDIEAMQDRRIRLPEGERGGYGFVQGTDGRLYLGTHSGRLFRLDLDTERLEEIGRPFADGRMIWGGGGSSAGRIYMGVYPTGEFCEYDIETESLEVFSPVSNDGLGLYARSFLELPDGTIFVVVGGAKPAFFLYDPVSRQCECVWSGDPEQNVFPRVQGFYDAERLLISDPLANCLKLFNWRTLRFERDEPWPELPTACCHIEKADEKFYTIGNPSDHLYRITEHGMEVVKDEFPNDATISCFHHLAGDRFMALSDNGLFLEFDLLTGEESHFQVRNESDDGMGIQFLSKIPGKDLIVGAHHICMQMFRVDLGSGRSESSLNKISGYGGQVICGTYLGGTFYPASYIKAVVYAMDPEESFEYGVNPRTIGEIGEQQNRPVAAVNDGRLIYIATKSGYGTLGGAITVLDPETGEMAVYRHFVKDQNPTALFLHAASRSLVGTTQIHGECSTHVPVATHAVVFVWDTQARKTVHTCSPFEVESLGASALSADGRLIGFHDDEYFLFDVKTGEWTTHQSPVERVTNTGIFVDEDRFIGATAECLFLLDLRSNEVEILTETEDTHHIERISDTELAYDYRRTEIRRLSWE